MEEKFYLFVRIFYGECIARMKKKLFLLFFCAAWNHVRAQDTLVIDTATHFQTMEGWGHGGGVLGHCAGPYGMLDSTVADPVNFQTLDYLVDDLGLTGSRTWEVGPRIDGTGMDNGDCDSIDWNKFQPQSLPQKMADYLMYYKNRIVAEGYTPSFYSSPGYPTHATDLKPWIMFHPGERAQQIWSSALYMKNTFGIDINYDVIYNEPSGNVTAAVLADDIIALAPRLQSHGLATRSQFPEAVAPLTAWNNFITPVQNDSELWTNVGRLSYHNYGTADPYRSMIYNFGLPKGITTAQTEMSNPTFDDLYSDLTLGNVSYWEVAYSGSNTLVPDSGLTAFTPSNTYFRIRQVLHYVRPGAVRVQTVSNDSMLHVLAFSNHGSVTIIVENISATTQNIFLSGIPSGMYGLCKASPGGTFFQELGIRTITGDTITIPASGGSAVTTLYPYALPNHAPAIMTFKTVPGYLVAPASVATLIASANDAELDPHTFQWSVTSFPAGAAPIIASPNTASTSVSGLTVAGTYVFTIDVSDGINTSTKKVYLIAYGADPPPVLGNCGFRIAAPYGLVFGNRGDTTHANIELPLSSVVLQANTGVLSGNSLAVQGTWSLIQQPGGANAMVDSTIYIYVSLRANATNLTVPGDYVFQVNVLNPGHPDLTQQVICTVHPASSAPVINSITPSPPLLTLPASATLLTAVTSDPDLDLLRHWWAIVAAPSGSQPQFDYQCKPITNVTGLTVPGIYTFQLRAFDDLHEVTQNVSVQVNAATGVENISATDDEVSIYPNPFNNELTIAVKNMLPSAIIVYDITSRKLFRQTFSSSLSLSTGMLESGIYIYEIENKTGVIRKGKIVKQ
jgi:hypothetical protein